MCTGLEERKSQLCKGKLIDRLLTGGLCLQRNLNFGYIHIACPICFGIIFDVSDSITQCKLTGAKDLYVTVHTSYCTMIMGCDLYLYICFCEFCMIVSLFFVLNGYVEI